MRNTVTLSSLRLAASSSPFLSFSSISHFLKNLASAVFLRDFPLLMFCCFPLLLISLHPSQYEPERMYCQQRGSQVFQEFVKIGLQGGIKYYQTHLCRNTLPKAFPLFCGYFPVFCSFASLILLVLLSAALQLFTQQSPKRWIEM